MSEADVTAFKVEVELGATISIKTGDGEWNYVKPSVSASITWRGVPTDLQLADAVELLSSGTTEPVLNEIILASNERLKELNGL